MMKQNFVLLMLVGCGGFLGAIFRYGILWLGQHLGLRSFLALLGANALGCFLAGLIVGFILVKNIELSWLKPFLIVGFLGALTTFSSFGLELLDFSLKARWLSMLFYGLGTLVVCAALTFFGYFLSQSFFVSS